MSEVFHNHGGLRDSLEHLQLVKYLENSQDVLQNDYRAQQKFCSTIYVACLWTWRYVKLCQPPNRFEINVTERYVTVPQGNEFYNTMPLAARFIWKWLQLRTSSRVCNSQATLNKTLALHQSKSGLSETRWASPGRKFCNELYSTHHISVLFLDFII